MRLDLIYDNLLTKISWLCLFLLLFAGCSDEISKESHTSETVIDDLADKITWRKDGKEMVLISAGHFYMGDHSGRDETALRHKVELDAFYIDSTEVTVGQFRWFLAESGYQYKGNWGDVSRYAPGDEYPMVYVDWDDAAAYAKWPGKRLPTEAEWEKSARGRLKDKFYVWGNNLAIASVHANFAGIQGKDQWEEKTAPVGSFFPNGYGLYDMAGNVYEWCADWYDEGYYTNSSYKNPKGPESSPKSRRVLRGGSWDYFTSYTVRSRLVSARYGSAPSDNSNTFGFRCVSNVETHSIY